MAVRARARSTAGGPDLTSAARLWGTLAGIGGLVHGVGEIAQGNVSAPGLFIPSWATGPIADNLGGEPGLTVVPNLLVTGILTVLVASLLIAASTARAPRPVNGWILIGLSTGMLLVGGGVGPPVLGLCAGAAALAAGRARASSRAPRHGALWLWLFWLSLADTAFLVLGSLFAALVLDVDVSSAFVYAFLGAIVLLPATIVAGLQATTRGPPP